MEEAERPRSVVPTVPFVVALGDIIVKSTTLCQVQYDVWQYTMHPIRLPSAVVLGASWEKRGCQ
jgi:hypothetical protein